MKTIELKKTNLKILKHYSGVFWFVMSMFILYFIGLLPIEICFGIVLIDLIINLISLPLLMSYLKIEDITILRDHEIVKNNKTYNHNRIKQIDFAKPLANIGNFSFAKFNFIRLHYDDGSNILITSLMYFDLESLLKTLPKTEMKRIKCLFCSLNTQQ